MISLEWYALPQLAHDLAILLAYSFIGCSIKFIDQAFDIGVFSKRIALLLSVPMSVLMGLLMVFDPLSASIFMAVALGAAVAGKIDNIAFKVGVGLLMLIPVFFSDIIKLFWLPFGVLFIAAVIDEYGNDWSDAYNRKINIKRKKNRVLDIAAFFFTHRSVMKLTVLALVVTDHLLLLYLPAFLLLDLGYHITEKISFTIKPSRLKNPNNKLSQITLDTTLMPGI
ncbi:hypothetical protein GF319_03245 [Candidatus Bathyarchaeota archaeon]|nr:hypothetical protein [Candidatus Bathyarchaeota archaeon]